MTPQTLGQLAVADMERSIAAALAEARRLNTDPKIRDEDWQAVAGDFAAVMGDFRRALNPDPQEVEPAGQGLKLRASDFKVPPRRRWWHRLPGWGRS